MHRFPIYPYSLTFCLLDTTGMNYFCILQCKKILKTNYYNYESDPCFTVTSLNPVWL